MLLAALALSLFCGAAFAAGDETPWKVRRPADNTVLPSEFVHRPGAGEPLPADAGKDEPDGRSETEGADAVAAAQPAPEAGGKAEKPDQEAASEEPARPAPTPAVSSGAPAANMGRAGNLESVNLAKGVALFLPLDRPAAEPRTFLLKQPARMVFDLMGAWDNVGSNVYRLDSPLVEKVVVGEHAEYLRLVVYLNEAAGVTSLAAKTTFTPEGMRLELDSE
jgi:hypothetical protein